MQRAPGAVRNAMDDVACVIVNPDHSIVRTAEKLCLVDFLNLLVANEPFVTRRIS